MDSIPNYEFHRIFRRLSYDVDLKGALTPDDIDERLGEAQETFRNKAVKTANPTARRALYKKARAIEILQDKGFALKTVAEASENRYGIVNLTLHYGRKKAEEMKLAFERSRIRIRGTQRRRRVF